MKAKLTKCPSCGASRARPMSQTEEFKVGAVIYRARVALLKCALCGESTVVGPSMMAAEHAVARAIARSGRVTGESFAFMRTAFGWKATEIAELLGVSSITISRWENGRREMEPLAWALLAELVLADAKDRPTTREILETIRRPPKLGRAVQIEWEAPR